MENVENRTEGDTAYKVPVYIIIGFIAFFVGLTVGGAFATSVNTVRGTEGISIKDVMKTAESVKKYNNIVLLQATMAAQTVMAKEHLWEQCKNTNFNNFGKQQLYLDKLDLYWIQVDSLVKRVTKINKS